MVASTRLWERHPEAMPRLEAAARLAYRMAVVDAETERVLIEGKELLRLAHHKTDRLRAELGYAGPELRWDE